MDRPEVGDEITVSLTGIVVKATDHAGCLKIRTKMDNVHYVFPGDRSVTMTTIRKAFLPRRREVYRVGIDGTWLVAEKDHELVMISSAGKELTPEEFDRMYGDRAKRILESPR